MFSISVFVYKLVVLIRQIDEHSVLVATGDQYGWRKHILIGWMCKAQLFIGWHRHRLIGSLVADYGCNVHRHIIKIIILYPYIPMVMCDTTELFAQSLWHSIKELNYIFNSIELEMVVGVWIHRYLYIVMLVSNSVPTTIEIVQRRKVVG